MTKVTIDRELLEDAALWLEAHSPGSGSAESFTAQDIRAILAAPRQPEGEGMEVVGLQWLDTGHYRKKPPKYGYNPYDWNELCRLSDAQRAIAELREECERLRGECARLESKYGRDVWGLNNEGDPIGGDPAGGFANDLFRVTIERDTLRQQLDERDAENERLRVKLMTIASAEPRRHNIEWAKAMAATGNNAAYAKWRAAFDQCGRLAELLRQARLKMGYMLNYGEWYSPEELLERIDATLAEVKPCTESHNPAAT